MKIQELDSIVSKCATRYDPINETHPSFTDPVYAARKRQFSVMALDYKQADELPIFEYTEEETDTWRTIFRRLEKIKPTHACKEHLRGMEILKSEFGFNENEIPQLRDVSRLLEKRNGFRLRPANGLINQRHFWSGMAFRVAFASPFIRHSSRPEFGPEPDICHDLLGHLPFLIDPAYGQFVQEIGLATLGAPDAWCEKLIRSVTLEYGLCIEDGRLKAYGGGVLSSYGELEYSLSHEPELRKYETEDEVPEAFPDTKYQPAYYVDGSFKEFQRKIRRLIANSPRGFDVQYDPQSQEVKVTRAKSKL